MKNKLFYLLSLVVFATTSLAQYTIPFRTGATKLVVYTFSSGSAANCSDTGAGCSATGTVLTGPNTAFSSRSVTLNGNWTDSLTGGNSTSSFSGTIYYSCNSGSTFTSWVSDGGNGNYSNSGSLAPVVCTGITNLNQIEMKSTITATRGTATHVTGTMTLSTGATLQY